MDAERPLRDGSRRDIAGFVAVLAVATVPFYVVGPLIGSLSALTRGNVPGAAPAFVCPAAAAAVIAVRTGTGTQLLTRVALRPHGALFAVAALAAMPAVLAFSAVLSGQPRAFDVPGFRAVDLAAVFLVSAFTEEIGWTAFLLPRVLQISAMIPGAILIGLIWALWHVLSHVQTGHTASWIAGQVIFTVALRVLIVVIAVGSVDLAGGTDECLLQPRLVAFPRGRLRLQPVAGCAPDGGGVGRPLPRRQSADSRVRAGMTGTSPSRSVEWERNGRTS